MHDYYDRDYSEPSLLNAQLTSTLDCLDGGLNDGVAKKYICSFEDCKKVFGDGGSLRKH
jgi:hypothetical protein